MDCPDCTCFVPESLDQCPHCGRPALFPNVRMAEDQDEVRAVEERCQRARAEAAQRKCADVAEAFEAAATTAHAVIGRSAEEALRLAKSDSEGYATFYQLLHVGARLPDGGRWTRLRGLADWELFGPSRDRIRFAALSVDGVGLPHYGEVSLELKDSMIAHRATIFDENSAVFFERQRKEGNEPPAVAGHRARWSDRGKLALAKHAAELDPGVTSADFPTILLHAGPTPADDVFIEVHVYGSMTRRSLAAIVVDGTRVSPAVVADLRERLGRLSVSVGER